MAKREISEINAGSMADIAFLLLIFFLVTTTMDTDMGLIRRLPEINPEQTDPPPIKKRNIFEVLVNQNDQLLVEGEYMEIADLRASAKEFIESDATNPNMPEFKMTEIPRLGVVPVSKQIISLQNDMGTSYEMYIMVQNELVAAYNELRNEFAQQKFNKPYTELVQKSGSSEKIKEQMKAVKKFYPQRISEAEPKKTGGN